MERNNTAPNYSSGTRIHLNIWITVSSLLHDRQCLHIANWLRKNMKIAFKDEPFP